jgi:predicted metal-dependent hydrolase
VSSSEVIHIVGIEVQVNRKPIKFLHLSVLLPNGRAKKSVLMSASEQVVRLAVINKLAWIKKQQADF